VSSPSACMPTAPGQCGQAWAILNSVVPIQESEPRGKSNLAACLHFHGESKCFQAGRKEVGCTLRQGGAEGRRRALAPVPCDSEHFLCQAERAEQQQYLFPCLFACVEHFFNVKATRSVTVLCMFFYMRSHHSGDSVHVVSFQLLEGLHS